MAHHQPPPPPPPPPSHPPRQFYVAVGTSDQKLPTIVELFQALVAPPSSPPNNVSPLVAVVACASRDGLDRACGALRGAAAGGSRDLSLFVLHGDLSDRELEQHASDFRARVAAAAKQQVEAPASAAATDAAAPALAAAVAPTATATTTGTAAAAAAAAALRPRSALLMLATDACLRALQRLLGGGGALPPPPLLLAPAPPTAPAEPAATPATADRRPVVVPPPLLVQFDLPTTREAFVSRLAVAFGAKAAAGGARKASAGGGGGGGGGGAAATAAPAAPIVIDFFSADEVPLFRVREKFLPGQGVEEMPINVTEVFAGAEAAAVVATPPPPPPAAAT